MPIQFEGLLAEWVFRSITRLLEGSPLEKELNGEASYTLFAPADIAFAYLSPETIDQLLHAENQGNLADVLGYNADSAKYGRATDLLMVGFYRCAFGTWIQTEV